MDARTRLALRITGSIAREMLVILFWPRYSAAKHKVRMDRTDQLISKYHATPQKTVPPFT
jgi:hypothetical protein